MGKNRSKRAYDLAWWAPICCFYSISFPWKKPVLSRWVRKIVYPMRSASSGRDQERGEELGDKLTRTGGEEFPWAQGEFNSIFASSSIITHAHHSKSGIFPPRNCCWMPGRERTIHPFSTNGSLNNWRRSIHCRHVCTVCTEQRKKE